MTSFLFEIFFYKLLILCRIHQTELFQNIIEIFPPAPIDGGNTNNNIRKERC